MSMSAEEYASLAEGDLVTHVGGKVYRVWNRKGEFTPWFVQRRDGKDFGPAGYRFKADRLVAGSRQAGVAPNRPRSKFSTVSGANAHDGCSHTDGIYDASRRWT